MKANEQIESRLERVQGKAKDELAAIVAEVHTCGRRPSLQLEVRSCRRVRRPRKITGKVTWLFKLLIGKKRA
ncbi:MAG: hypothetical protein KDB07_01565 [Planctomycetes bacterium]|nr:hypothetical protein [Planctomycetota bacterium]